MRLALCLTSLLVLGGSNALPRAYADEVADHGAHPSAPGQAATADASRELGWKSYKTKRGIEVFRRSVDGSRFYEYRATIESPLPPERIITDMWDNAMVKRAPMVKYRQIIRQLPDEIVLYDQLKTPVIADRDFTLLIRKVVDPVAHRYQMTFDTANHLGPPEDRKHVRITRIRGAWIVEANGKGGSRLTYRSFSEPGGSIPAFLIHGAQFDQVIWDVERILERLSNLPAS